MECVCRNPYGQLRAWQYSSKQIALRHGSGPEVGGFTYLPYRITLAIWLRIKLECESKLAIEQAPIEVSTPIVIALEHRGVLSDCICPFDIRTG